MLTHFMIRADECASQLLGSSQATKQFMQSLPVREIIDGPRILKRNTGFCAVVITQNGHAVLSVNTQEKSVLLDVMYRTRTDVTPSTFLEKILSFTQAKIEHVSYREAVDGHYDAVECQEPRCTRQASKYHNSLTLCKDHYEEWLEQEEEEKRMNDY